GGRHAGRRALEPQPALRARRTSPRGHPSSRDLPPPGARAAVKGPDGRVPRRYVRLQLSRVARAVLPREAAGGRYARVLRRRLPRGRDQQHVLPDAGAEDARLMGRADAAALPLRVEGAAADHAPIAPEGGRRADARVRATERGARREAWSAALPASAQPEGRPRSARDVPRRDPLQPRARLRVPPRL